VGATLVVAPIVYYITGHGLGHASRSLEVIDALIAGSPDQRTIVRSSAPAWFFRNAPPQVEFQAFEADTGVAQIDSLRIDEQQTARAAAVFYRDFDQRIATESRFLQSVGAAVVVGDIPPLAFAAAAQAGLPSIAIANFTWDWIYRGYPEFDTLAPGVIAAVEQAYRAATKALRLPMHGGFHSMAAMTRDIPFVARRSARDPLDTRRQLGLSGDRPVVLASFGASAALVPLDEVSRSTAMSIVEFPREPPPGLTYPDIVAAADVVVSKPGYGIISECLANDTALVFTSRGRFVEYDVLVAEMPRVLRCQFLAPEDFVAGRWGDAVRAVLAQPPPSERARIDGAEIAAEEILTLIP
jgi:L-arabinokinase